MLVDLYAPVILRRAVFYAVSSALCFVLKPFSPGVGYQVLHPYVMAGRTTAEYIVFDLRNDAPHVDAVSLVSAAIWVVALTFVMFTCGPHLSLESTWTPSTRSSFTGPSVNFSMLTVAYILNVFFLVKCIRWYLSGAKITPWVRAH